MGLVAAAAPIRDFRGRIVAALNVSAPSFRFEKRLEPAGEAVRSAAEELSLRMGFYPERRAAAPRPATAASSRRAP